MEKDISWQTLSSEYLIKRPWLTARRDVVRLPNGVVQDEYYVLEYPDWINVIALTRDGRMILERQYRHALGETSYEIVAGVMEQGESPEEAARRELLEETGYSGGEWTHLMDLSANPSTMTNLCHCFLAVGVEPTGHQHLDRTEYLEVHFFQPEEVWQMLLDGQFRQALMAAPLWRFFHEQREVVCLGAIAALSQRLCLLVRQRLRSSFMERPYTTTFISRIRRAVDDVLRSD